MPGRYRHMYNLTGLPGWMRCGYSPGWGGMPPGATYMMTGQWPTAQAQTYWDMVQSGQADYPWVRPGMTYEYPGHQPPPGPGMTPEQELEVLRNQAKFLGQQIEQINSRIKELEKRNE